MQVARLEWEKFASGSPEAVAEEFRRHQDPEHVRLHLDHVPVIDEDQRAVDYLPILRRAIAAGYQSVMVDGSRLSLEENIRATRAVAELAHAAGIPCEAELGAVLGHEAGPLPPYEELFASGRGFTDPEEAARFVRESGCDWLSVAIGNIHGAISAGRAGQEEGGSAPGTWSTWRSWPRPRPSPWCCTAARASGPRTYAAPSPGA